MTERRPTPFAARLERVPPVVAAVLVTLGCAVLAGWAFRNGLLKALVPGAVAMNPATAVAFILSGVSLWMLRTEPAASSRGPGYRAGQLCALVVAAVGLLRLAGYLGGGEIGVDQLLFRADLAAAGPPPGNRMSPNTAICFLLMGGALLLLDWKTQRFLRPAQILTATAGLIAFLALAGYAYSVPLYGVRSYIPMALNTALAFVALCAGFLAARPTAGPMAIVTSEHAGGALARSMLPATVGIPVVLGMLALVGEQQGLYDSRLRLAITVVGSTAVFTSFVLTSARGLDAAERTRRHAQDEADRFFSLSRDMLCIAGEDGYFRRVNPTFEATLGYSATELLADPFFSFVHPEDVGATQDELAKLGSGIPTIHFENRYRCRDGSYRWLAWTASPVVDGCTHAAARDVTEQKRMEGELQHAMEAAEAANLQLAVANKELEAFSYSVSHDLRAPLRSIDGFSEALTEDYAGVLDAEGNSYLQRIRSAAQRMAQLIDDLLDLSRVSRAEMRREEVDLTGTAEAIAAELRTTEPERQASLLIQPGLTATGDPRLLRVVLENLIGNAWKYTAKRSTARIEMGSTCHEGKAAYFVRDDGAGFDMAYAGKLFGAFQRLHGMNEFPGTGIGLATVQRIIHRHGGRVWAEAAVDQGATFYFTLQSADLS